MRFYQSRLIPDGFELRSVTVRQKADGWYVAIQIEDKTIPQSLPKDLDSIKSVIGVDLGIKKLLALSNGEQIKNPQFENQLERTKSLRHRRASRKKRGSRNQKKAYQKLAILEQKIGNQRNDYQWKVAHHLANLAELIVLEDLNIQGMIKRCKPKQDEKGKYLKNGQSAKQALNRLMRDCSWGELKLKIQSVAEKFGCIYLEVNPKHTSQRCSNCGHIDSANRNKEKFVCVSCGFIADADNQAAINIGKKGLEILGISPTKLLGVPQKVTSMSESTDTPKNSREKSISLEVEPTNPLQLTLFEWRGEQVIVYPESPTIARRA
jgi:putative transposase